MMSKISTISAFVTALSLTNAAPMPQSSSSSSGGQIGIRVQLAGFDAASVISANLDQTTVASRSQITEAQVNQNGPWCAGFSDTGATRLARTVNGNDIFDSQNAAVYSDDNDQTVTVASYWCASTRREVENFVARAGNGNGNGNNQEQPEPVNNNNGGNNNGATVRVQIELEAGTTFVQEELTANGNLISASNTRNLRDQVVSIDINGQGNCQFFADNNGQRAAQFPGTVRSFRCNA